jgi:hypothetical protein
MQPYLALITPLSPGGPGIDNTLPSAPVYPGHGLPTPPGPIDPGWGVTPPVDPGYGRPGFAPGLPGHDLPWAPARPGHDLPNAPGRPDNTLPGDSGFGLPGVKGFVFAFVPGTGWGWVDVELGQSNKVYAYVAGFGWTWIPVAIPPTTKPLPPEGEVPPAEVDNTLPPEPAPK